MQIHRAQERGAAGRGRRAPWAELVRSDDAAGAGGPDGLEVGGSKGAVVPAAPASAASVARQRLIFLDVFRGITMRLAARQKA